MKLEPIEFGVGELTLEKLGIKRPEPEPSEVNDEPDVSEPIEEPEMAEPVEPAASVASAFAAAVADARCRWWPCLQL